MRWKKLGQVFCPQDNFPWMKSHAANPVAESLGGDLFRIYFTCRDGQNRSHIASLDLDINDPRKLLRLDDEPLLGPGKLGTFDDSGAALGCVLDIGGTKFLYYLGWNLGVTVPWRNSIGLAVLPPGEKRFMRVSEAPILDRNALDPFSLSYPWVLREGGRWRMWYGSNLSWGVDQRDMDHVIKYAESADGFAWTPTGRISIGLEPPGEYAVAKPCVLRDRDCYRMWYAHRGPAYRIGYAESPDGLDWRRKDENVGIDVAEEGWDSGMIEYASVFDHGGQRYMLYNGARYGATGFGLAMLEQP